MLFRSQSLSLQSAERFELSDPSGEALFSPELSSHLAGGKLRAVSHDDIFRRLQLPQLPAPQYASTPHGIQTQLPVVPLASCLPQTAVVRPHNWFVAILGCEHNDHVGALLGRVCYIPPSESGVQYLSCGDVGVYPGPQRGSRWSDLFPLSAATLERCRDDVELKTVFLSHPRREVVQPLDAQWLPQETIKLVLGMRNRDALRAQGYTAEVQCPDRDHPATHWLKLSNDAHTITIEYRHTLKNKGQELSMEVEVKKSQSAGILTREVKAKPSSLKWWDSMPWSSSLEVQQVAFATAREKVVVELSFDSAGPSAYVLRVNINTTITASSRTAESWHSLEDVSMGASNASAQDPVGQRARYLDNTEDRRRRDLFERLFLRGVRHSG